MTPVNEIMELCLLIDQKASDLYLRFSETTKEKDLKDFWDNMSAEESEHMGFWKSALELARLDAIPDVFDDSGETIAELKRINRKVDELWAIYEKDPSINNMFFLSYRMEFYLLHPAFEILFRYMDIVGGKKSPETEYGNHLNKFINMLDKYASVTPELDLLGETIQSLWQKNRDLADQCFMDDLTGVCNRKGFFQAVKPLAHLARRNALSIGVLMADIDDFKKINDTHGHQKGDQILKQVGRLMKSNLRSSDVVGRYGGEEFVSFLYDVKPLHAEKVAEKIRTLIEEETLSNIPFTISIGLAVGPVGPDVEEEIMTYIDRADNCLYQAKNAGKNRVVSSCIKNGIWSGPGACHE